MLRAEKELEKEISVLIRRAEILDAQKDGKYGKGKLGSDLPKELQLRQARLAAISRARKALEAETAAAAADATDADAAADASEQQKLADKAARTREKADSARELAIEKANEAGLEPQGLEPQPADAMPYRGLAHRADGSPTAKTQRNHRFAEACGYTDADSHIVISDANVLQGAPK